MAKKEEEASKLKQQGETLSLPSYKNNIDVLNFFRVMTSVLSGTFTGILGITGWSGFLVYFLFHILVAIPLAIKANFEFKKYFSSWRAPLTSMIVNSTGLLCFILFWIMFYNLAHVF